MSLTKDPLLSVAKVVLALCIVLFIFLMAMMLIGIGALLTVGRPEVMAELADADSPASVYWAVIGVLVLVEVLLAAILKFLLELRGIVKSVERGDPFEPANADRLSRMGWLTVGGYAVAVVLGAAVAWIKSAAGEAGKDINVDFGLDGGGILLILVLFILARVFRQGAAMRADLEGTV